MSKNSRTASQTPGKTRWFRRLFKPLFGLGAAALVATAASGTEVALAGISTASTTSHARPELAALAALGTYDASTRKALEAVARYPNRAEARNARLQGKVAVEFQLNRQGTLQDAEIVETSGSKILDATALASVRWAKYQALPAELPSGENGRRYKVTFDYRFLPRD